MLLMGSGIETLGVFLTSICTEYWQLMLSQGVLLGLENALLYTPGRKHKWAHCLTPSYDFSNILISSALSSLQTVSASSKFSSLLLLKYPRYENQNTNYPRYVVVLVGRAFKRHRAIAMSTTTCGAPTGGAIYTFAFAQLISRMFFGRTVCIMGFIMLGIYCLAFPLILWVRGTLAIFLRGLRESFSTAPPSKASLSGAIVRVPSSSFVDTWYYSSTFIAIAALYGCFSGASIPLPPSLFPVVCPDPTVFGARLGMAQGINSLEPWWAMHVAFWRSN